MSPRPAWKGYLKLSLVSCAVELTNATTQAEKVSFRTLNRKTGNPVRRQYVDSVTGKAIDPDDEVKGYELGEDEYVLVEQDEIEAVQIESNHTLAIEGFVDKDEIAQIYLDTPYYLTPSDEVSVEAFAVIREAMRRQGKAGLARIVLYNRERPVVIEPLEKGLLLTTLRYRKTVREPDVVMDDIPKTRVDADMIDLATHIISRKAGVFDPDQFEDRYEDALLEIIEAKKRGTRLPLIKAQKPPANVVNLFDALKRSLADDSGGGSGGRQRRSGAAKSGSSGKSSAKAGGTKDGPSKSGKRGKAASASKGSTGRGGSRKAAASSRRKSA